MTSLLNRFNIGDSGDVDLPEATSHYHRQRFDMEEPDLEWKLLILALFEKHEGRYAYHRIHLELRAKDTSFITRKSSGS
ncbi:hypothetical protein [Planococcus shixiaomingii]|uniref:hypothetical protein n=1 Tax=Planococcus shixiaomingii TaxID=3058393 RepID=UPI00260B05E4|nr:hypothetical protein [Planococcus sp. N022]WKA53991.1 hypothetical protein QWY21_15160 [Planococcus sp. N022]